MLKTISLLALLSICVIASHAQTPIRDAVRHSHTRIVYRIPADSAAFFLEDKMEPDPATFAGRPAHVEWDWEEGLIPETLPTGHYLVFWMEEHQLKYQYFNPTRLMVRALNNEHRVQLELRDSTGYPALEPRLWIGKKEIPYNPAITGFMLPARIREDQLIRIAAGTDTSFVTLASMDIMRDSRWKQWWTHFGRSPVGRVLAWPGRTIERLAEPYNYGSSYQRPRRSAQGYMIFNQALYKPNDTVRFKAYVLDRRNKPYRRATEIRLNFSSRQGQVSKKMGSLQASYRGSFNHWFVLGDSLESDRDYRLSLTGKKDRTLVSGNFRVEDYLNEEVSVHELKASSKKYVRGDSLVFTASARDANDLAILDGRVRFYLLSQGTARIYPDTLFIPDTLVREEMDLQVDSGARLVVPSKALPDADLNLKLVAVFLDSRNEMHEEQQLVTYHASRTMIASREEAGFLLVDYLVDGKSMPVAAKYIIDDDGLEREIDLPAKLRINPFAESYLFRAGGLEHDVDFSYDRSYLDYELVREETRSGFQVQNPLGLLVHYSIFFGNRLITAGTDSSRIIRWTSDIPQARIYNVVLNYMWRGRESSQELRIASIDKLLTTSIQNKELVYPGQSDSITVKLTDRKGRPAPNVNLTAATYNTQHHKHIRAPSPIILQKFRDPGRVKRDSYETEEAFSARSWNLAADSAWSHRLRLDTMPYYQLLKPVFPFTNISRPITDVVPQVSVHVVQKGVPKQIHLLSVNNILVWYGQASARPPYSFQVMPGYAKFNIRLDSAEWIIDSIYLQPGYKHDISFDLDKLPAGAKKLKRPVFLEPDEKFLLQNSFMIVEHRSQRDSAFLWQPGRVLKLKGNNLFLAGPFFSGDSISYFKPGDFDLKIPFEPGYRYRFSGRVARLEKIDLFPLRSKIRLTPGRFFTLNTGDTVPDQPIVAYPLIKTAPPLLEAMDNWRLNIARYSRSGIQLHLPEGIKAKYLVLDNGSEQFILDREFSQPVYMQAGQYQLVLVTQDDHYLVASNLYVREHGILHVQLRQDSIESTNALIDRLHQEYLEVLAQRKIQEESRLNKKPKPASAVRPPLPEGTAGVFGVVTDKLGGKPISGVALMFQHYDFGVSTDSAGRFEVKNIKAGRYLVFVSAVGYGAAIVPMDLVEGQLSELPISLHLAETSLSEVVVIGYGTTRRNNLTGSITTMQNQLMGRAAGVTVAGATSSIRIRGINSVNGNFSKGAHKPMIILDGVEVEEMPEATVLAGAQVDMLKDVTAISIYGSRAGNGVIIINTRSGGEGANAMRENFSDFTAWYPDLFTDRNGEVRFTVHYPDNITGWQIQVTGMDKKKRFAQGASFARSFKPLSAALAIPSFLVEGDSAALIGRVLNYTDQSKILSYQFEFGAELSNSGQLQVEPNGSAFANSTLVARTTDTITSSFAIRSPEGYGDGEKRKIPVFRQGVKESRGSFWVVESDSLLRFEPEGDSPVTVFAENNTLDLLLQELDRLKDYPYFCTEQITSKLKGLVMEKQIRLQLGQRFKHDKLISTLRKRLLESQSYDGGFPWWPGGSADLSITNYIVRLLLEMGDDPVLKTATRDGLLYLQHQIINRPRSQSLDILWTLSEAGHVYDYGSFLESLVFDSLDTHQQWIYVRILQKTKRSLQPYLDKLLLKKQEYMLGSIYWGVENQRWNANAMASTVLAFRVLREERGYQEFLPLIIRYFLEKRPRGYWSNTVESASTISVILPYLLQMQPAFTDRTSLEITQGETVRFTEFPVHLQLNGKGPVEFKRQGGGLLYLTASQEFFIDKPSPVRDQFEISSWLEVNGKLVSELKQGQKAKLKLRINTKKYSEYVQVEIPIPAGCTYASKKQTGNLIHTEYLKDRVVFFATRMDPGSLSFEIDLEPRFSGSYTLNPASASLMYFPVFFGRNEIKTLTIQK